MLAIRYKDVFMWECSSFFAEAAGNQHLERIQDLVGLAAFGFHIDGAAGARRQHHQAHDRCAADRGAFTGHPNDGVEALHSLNEPG
jgi:hypothetical protein